MTPVLGIPYNPIASDVPAALISAAERRNVSYRSIDLSTMTVAMTSTSQVADRHGLIEVTHLAPALLYWQPVAVHALTAMSAMGVRALNSVAATQVADDKAATALFLQAGGIPQLPTTVCPQSLSSIAATAEIIGYPVVVKRTHGAQGRWVRSADGPARLADVFGELVAEGPGALVVQPMVVESAGQSVRTIVTLGEVRAATLRTASGSEWRSNITRGGMQRAVDLSAAERDMSVAAVSTLGLGHAGVDLLRTKRGTVVLEVNSCPDFTSMRDHTETDLAGTVVAAALSC